ncbi:PHB depolymerase family esterase [Undibacterium sp. CY18W]|uniref:PHB depolymerase family esterase n=1 Tax=Undibacterium hunanense TaxID=2762292 RepID=A0ABR6ZQT0_9BURK|nr:PHB depolymerase family esterase [Undibacterium hunanense]MBC3918227.1 PHB depolymerase family esterase [Undibacterium hunanense]
MTKRIGTALWRKSFTRIVSKMAKTATRAGSRVIREALTTAPEKRKRLPVTTRPVSKKRSEPGLTVGMTGARRYRLYKPPGVRGTESLPLIVMLHGCGQDAAALAASTRMNQIARRERFLVLYPEQERLANVQACWNWYDTRSGRAQREADSIDVVIDQICLTQPVDSRRIALAGLSAGASMAALMAIRHPERFRVLAMHSGIATGLAHSSATAIMAMRGRRLVADALPAGLKLPALLIMQGSKDHVVAPVNSALLAQQWAAQSGAKAGMARTVQRGARYPATMTDYRIRGQIVITLCEINGLDHAWSGGAAGHAYSDPKGPDASGMIWAFARKQFAYAA